MRRKGLGHCPPRAVRTNLAGAGLLLTIVLAPSPAVPAGDPGADADERCALCRRDLDVPVLRLTTAHLDSIAAGHAAFNEAQLARIDSVLRSGHWGPPDERNARECAHLMAQLTLANAYRDLVRMACTTDRVYELDEAALADLYERYADVNLFVGVRLAQLRIGRGRVCVRYSIEKAGEGEAWHGGRRLHWRVRDARIEGRERRVLDVVLPSGQDGEVRLMLASHYTMSVSYERSPGPPAPFEWFLVHDIEGVWIRKWGTHRPTAFMLWMSTPASMTVTASSRSSRNASSLPATPLLGLRVYVPGLKLRLPLLPDINVEDLREAEVITPVLDLAYLRRGDYPSWLEVNPNLGFEGWTGHGPVPPEIRRRFPDR